MADKATDTVMRAWARLMKAQQMALATVERALKEAGLPPLLWYDVLLEVERAGSAGIRPFELERAMLLAQYNLSRLLDRLAVVGYIERRACREDGRGQVVLLTESGRAVRRKMWPIYAHAIEMAIGRQLSAKQADVLDELLGRIIERQAGARP
jgi:DNA-binding MarR family transcriptional regulator